MAEECKTQTNLNTIFTNLCILFCRLKPGSRIVGRSGDEQMRSVLKTLYKATQKLHKGFTDSLLQVRARQRKNLTSSLHTSYLNPNGTLLRIFGLIVNSLISVWWKIVYLLTVFSRFRNIAKSDYELRYVCPSVHPHGKIWLPLERFSWNLTLEYFSRICRENLSFIYIWHE